MQNSRGDSASWFMPNLMVTCAIGFELASGVVLHSPVEFLVKVLSVLLMWCISKHFYHVEHSLLSFIWMKSPTINFYAIVIVGIPNFYIAAGPNGSPSVKKMINVIVQIIKKQTEYGNIIPIKSPIVNSGLYLRI